MGKDEQEIGALKADMETVKKECAENRADIKELGKLVNGIAAKTALLTAAAALAGQIILPYLHLSK